jgi:hypothetical protein
VSIGDTLAAVEYLCIEHVARTGTTGHTRDTAMANQFTPQPDPAQPIIYQIRLKGQLGRQWTDWFDGLTITLDEGGETLLTGPLADQAALHGLLKKVRDLGLTLISLNQVHRVERE